MAHYGVETHVGLASVWGAELAGSRMPEELPNRHRRPTRPGPHLSAPERPRTTGSGSSHREGKLASMSATEIRDPDSLSYEEARDELIRVVGRLEEGGATLEE